MGPVGWGWGVGDGIKRGVGVESKLELSRFYFRAQESPTYRAVARHSAASGVTEDISIEGITPTAAICLPRRQTFASRLC